MRSNLRRRVVGGARWFCSYSSAVLADDLSLCGRAGRSNVGAQAEWGVMCGDGVGQVASVCIRAKYARSRRRGTTVRGCVQA